MYDFTFPQIEAFLTVARYKNLSEAAEHMFVTQPALSRTLQRFEESIGTAVFTRSNKGVKLTPEGEYLFSALDPLYSNVGVVVRTVRELTSEQKKRLQIVQYISYDAVEDFDAAKAIVKEYINRYPDVDVIETLYDFQELRQQIEYGNADIAICQDFALAGIPNVTRRIISPYNMYAAISATHPLASHDVLKPELFRDEPLFIVPKTGTAFDREHALVLYGQLGFALNRIEFVPNFLTLLHTLRLRKGFSICGRFIFTGIDDIKYYPIPHEINPSRVVIAWRNGKLSAEAQSFIDMLPKSVEEGRVLST
ncbi:MAG: LysR family transcriptional regulator [Oscillospiraceae bacterium]|jgi:DNA-binding transcriptional LysR family regulator|nr:LysR family transcriptional regulator [Oscillospiraceae bacterium]